MDAFWILRLTNELATAQSLFENQGVSNFRMHREGLELDIVVQPIVILKNIMFLSGIYIIVMHSYVWIFVILYLALYQLRYQGNSTDSCLQHNATQSQFNYVFIPK